MLTNGYNVKDESETRVQSRIDKVMGRRTDSLADGSMRKLEDFHLARPCVGRLKMTTAKPKSSTKEVNFLEPGDFKILAAASSTFCYAL